MVKRQRRIYLGSCQPHSHLRVQQCRQGLTRVAGVTTKLATPVDTISTVSGTNLLMNCPVVEPSFCEYTPAASATRATMATAVLLTILLCTVHRSCQ